MGTSIADARTVEVAPGLYAYLQPDGGWFINNCGFLVGDDGVVLVDSAATEARTTALREAIAAVTPLPVRTLVNTHWHTDHTNGNSQFDGAVVIAHDAAREPMLELVPTTPDPDGPFPDVRWGRLGKTRPDVTVSDSLTVWAGDLRCEVRGVGGPAHTVGDLVAWIPEHGVLFAGDLAFNGQAPLVSAGSVSGSLRVLAELRDLAPAVVVPGHGELCGPEVFQIEIDYLTFVLECAEEGRRAGHTPLETARSLGSHPFDHLADAERMVANLHRAYAELDGAAPGAEIDLIATRLDMMALNGGKALTCHA